MQSIHKQKGEDPMRHRAILFALTSLSLVGCSPASQKSGDLTDKAEEQVDPAVALANANRRGDMGYKQGYFGSGDTRLHYVEAGQGPLVILHHGWPSFWYSWFDQMEMLKSDYRVVAVDGLGAGLSAKPHELTPYRLPALAAQLDDLARHLGGEEKFILIGHDWGSVLALSYAQAYPERLEKVIGMNAPPLNMFLKFLKDSPEQQQRSDYMVRIKDAKLWQMKAFGAGLSIAKRSYDGLVRRGQLEPEEAKLFHNAMSGADRMYAMMNWYRANIPAFDSIAETDMWPGPEAEITIPALIIWSEKDTVVIPELVDQLANASENITFVNLPGINHWTSMEKPELANQAIAEFLNKTGE